MPHLNSFPPSRNRTKPPSPAEAQVDEDAAPDSPVVAIRVTDADDGEAGRVVCEMTSENGMEYFKLVHDDGVSDMWLVQTQGNIFITFCWKPKTICNCIPLKKLQPGC